MNRKNLRWAVRNQVKMTNLYIDFFGRLLGGYLQNNVVISIDIDSSLKDDNFISIISNSPNVINLNLENCYELTDKSIFEISKKCPNLKSLNISGCKKITNDSIVQIIRYCPLLENLNLSNITIDNGFIPFIKNCKNLTSLSITKSPNLVDLIDLIMYFPKLSFLGQMQPFLLTHDLCKFIIETSEFENGFKNVTEINISDNQLIDEKSLIKLSKKFPNLIRFDCDNVKSLTDDVLLEIVKNCPNIGYLSISNCSKLTIDIINIIPQNLAHLEYLNISNLNFILNIRMITMIINACKLYSLDCFGHEIGSFVNYNIFSSCKTLKIINNIFNAKDIKL